MQKHFIPLHWVEKAATNFPMVCVSYKTDIDRRTI